MRYSEAKVSKSKKKKKSSEVINPYISATLHKPDYFDEEEP